MRPREAASLFATLSSYRLALRAIDRQLLAPADGAFNGRVARLLTAWQA